MTNFGWEKINFYPRKEEGGNYTLQHGNVARFFYAPGPAGCTGLREGDLILTPDRVVRVSQKDSEFGVVAGNYYRSTAGWVVNPIFIRPAKTKHGDPETLSFSTIYPASEPSYLPLQEVVNYLGGLCIKYDVFPRYAIRRWPDFSQNSNRSLLLSSRIRSKMKNFEWGNLKFLCSKVGVPCYWVE